MDFRAQLAAFPLIAILRGVKPDEIVGVGDALVEAGFRIIEVPLNSPEPLKSIGTLASRHPGVLVGAGTVLDPADVDRIRDVGGALIVMPHADIEVIGRAKQLGLACTPGAATPTEAFAALKAGADAVKLFPAEMLPPAIVKAWRAVFPAEVPLMPVGGVKPETMPAYWQAGARGFGLGSALYQPGMSGAEVSITSAAFARAVKELPGR
ncbi:KDPG and KHG aldolase [Ancylobacter novellus DSM 506]|uniref:KDPG and KHG aldolase n=1 Tax=Ancylobacter novellus (strain ATCC 8093 / DSM 506 / JCM 20403 / CCM 1077 / IAM 12100 / NBRC 12443 / NCIMB 10456) TaxID=639283 RepID=D7A0M3_ANCN5|nr:2-dehydro-3-deoxy-6-phosphogalactonate aldolase [Ancylobacter novellus]ADH91344.1 KDPG and KHG aldolase [Ancylobacter novellus DSM 506]